MKAAVTCERQHTPSDVVIPLLQQGLHLGHLRVLFRLTGLELPRPERRSHLMTKATSWLPNTTPARRQAAGSRGAPDLPSPRKRTPTRS